MTDNKTLNRAEIIAALRCCGNTDTKRPDCDHCPLNGYICAKRMLEGAADLLERDEPPNNPLTLEELRGMDGEPVWVQFGDGVEGNAVLEIYGESINLYGPSFDDHMYPDTDFINMEYDDPAGHFGLHLLGWRAYHRKLEGGGE